MNGSNYEKGRAFEELVRGMFEEKGILLEKNFQVDVGVAKIKKTRRFDLGSIQPEIIVECKAHSWTAGGNVPSAKLGCWLEAMYYFQVAPSTFRKIFVVAKSIRQSNDETLLNYFSRNYAHMIPIDVELMELDP